MKSIMRLIAFMPVFVMALSFVPRKIDLGEEQRRKIATDILNNFVKQDYEAVRKDFHSSLKVTLPVEKLAEAWETTVKLNGNFEKIISTASARTQDYNQVKIKCKFQNENITLETTFTEDDRVIGLFLKP